MSKVDYQKILDQVKKDHPELKHAEQTQMASGLYRAQKPEPKKEESKVITFKTEKELKDFVAKIIKDMNSEPVDKKSKLAIDVETLAEPVLFYTYDFAHTNMADRRNGKTVLPDRPIRFEHSYRYNMVGVNQSSSRMVNLCIAKVYTKGQVEYLRNHSRFGIQIFEDIKNVNAVDATRAHVAVEVNNYVSKLGTHQLIEKAKVTPGVTMDQDVDKVRHRLIQVLTDQEISNRKSLGQMRVMETARDYKSIKAEV
jgi:hypothetical protein